MIVRPKHVELNKKNKDYLYEVMHLVGSSTHCNMMHSTYNVKLPRNSLPGVIKTTEQNAEGTRRDHLRDFQEC